MSASDLEVMAEMVKRDIRDGIALGTDVLQVNKVKAGTKIVVGIGGDWVSKIANGEVYVGLYLVNIAEFKELRSEMDAALAAASRAAPDLLVALKRANQLLDCDGLNPKSFFFADCQEGRRCPRCLVSADAEAAIAKAEGRAALAAAGATGAAATVPVAERVPFGPFTLRHSEECAVRQPHWISDEPECTCGLAAAGER